MVPHCVKLEERNVDMLRLEKDQMNQDILESERQAREMGGLGTVKLCKAKGEVQMIDQVSLDLRSQMVSPSEHD